MSSRFTEWLNEELKARGWSQRELARRTSGGVSHSWIARVLANEAEPDWNFCAAVAGALGVPPSDVFRLAGLLPSLSRKTQLLEELAETAALLPESEQHVLLLAARGILSSIRGFASARQYDLPGGEDGEQAGDSDEQARAALEGLRRVPEPLRRYTIQSVRELINNTIAATREMEAAPADEPELPYEVTDDLEQAVRRLLEQHPDLRDEVLGGLPPSTRARVSGE